MCGASRQPVQGFIEPESIKARPMQQEFCNPRVNAKKNAGPAWDRLVWFAPCGAASGGGRFGTVIRAACCPFIHELVELGLVLGGAQLIEEGLESLLFLFQALQRLVFIRIKSGVASGAEPTVMGASMLAIAGKVTSVHAFAPDHVSEDGKACGPEKDEANDHCGDPGAFASFVQPSFGLRRPSGD